MKTLLMMTIIGCFGILGFAVHEALAYIHVGYGLQPALAGLISMAALTVGGEAVVLIKLMGPE